MTWRKYKNYLYYIDFINFFEKKKINKNKWHFAPLPNFKKSFANYAEDKLLRPQWAPYAYLDLFNVITTPLIFFHFSIKKVPRFISSLLKKKKNLSDEKKSTRIAEKKVPFIFFTDALFKSLRNFANFSRPSFNSSLFTRSYFRYFTDFSGASIL